MSYITRTIENDDVYDEIESQMSELGAGRIATSYDDVKAEPGKKYKVWFNRPAGLTDKAIEIRYKDTATGDKEAVNVFEHYKKYWNLKYSRRFEITQAPKLVDNGKYVYLEGIGGSTNETFGQLGLDKYWGGPGRPLWNWSLVYFIKVWSRREVHDISYAMIADENGYALVDVPPSANLPSGIKQRPPEIDPTIGNVPPAATVTGGGKPSIITSGGTKIATSTASASAKKFPTVPVIVGVATIATIIIGVLMATKKKKHTTSGEIIPR